MSDLTREETIILLDEIRKILLKNPSWDESTHEPINQTFDMAIEALENQKTGHWINVDYGYYECSECGRIEMGNPSYCADCGAKMEGE